MLKFSVPLRVGGRGSGVQVGPLGPRGPPEESGFPQSREWVLKDSEPESCLVRSCWWKTPWAGVPRAGGREGEGEVREGTAAAIQVRDDGGPVARVRATAVRAGRSNGLGNRWGDKGHDVVTACAGRGTREASSWMDGAAGVRGWRSWRRAGPGGRGRRCGGAGRVGEGCERGGVEGGGRKSRLCQLCSVWVVRGHAHTCHLTPRVRGQALARPHVGPSTS